MSREMFGQSTQPNTQKIFTKVLKPKHIRENKVQDFALGRVSLVLILPEDLKWVVTLPFLWYFSISMHHAYKLGFWISICFSYLSTSSMSWKKLGKIVVKHLFYFTIMWRFHFIWEMRLAMLLVLHKTFLMV